jgi:catechol-2,3-dioxygenase
MAAKRRDESSGLKIAQKGIFRRHVMARGSISHIALTVSDFERSTAFYDKVFEFIGFKRVEVPESTQQAMSR